MLLKDLTLQIVTKVYEGDEWLEKLPSELREVFFDNTYADALSRQVRVLVEFVYKQAARDLFDVMYEGYPLAPMLHYLEWVEAESSKSNKAQLLQRLREESHVGVQWVAEVPSEVSAAFFDNPFIAAKQNVIDLLMHYVFPSEQDYEIAQWLVYENLGLYIDGERFEPKTVEEAVELLTRADVNLF
jgi:hypothetical protein